MEKQEAIFKSRGNGKLLLSGEYLILKGAKGLSLPTKYGQNLEVYTHNGETILWESYNLDGLWHKVELDKSLKIIETTDNQFAERLQAILKQCLIQSTINASGLGGKKFITTIDFDTAWGLGSSSTLIYNLSQYFKIDAYELQLKTFNGSGYDVANAGIDSPIFYELNNKKPFFKAVQFSPSFKNQLFFIYSGRKVSSQKAISKFIDKPIQNRTITSVSQLSDLISVTNNIDDFIKLIKLHEDTIGELIDQKPLGKQFFSDFRGTTKSLGAWGGDFFLAATYENEAYVRNYFTDKGFEIIFNYDQIILQND